MKISQLTD